MGDDDEDCEEILVGVELSEPVPQWSPETNVKIIGLDSATPIVQYDKLILQGKWIDTIGTKLFFAEKPNPEATDPAFVPQVSQQFECRHKINKVLRLKTCVLNPREGSEDYTSEPESDGAVSEPEDKSAVNDDKNDTLLENN